MNKILLPLFAVLAVGLGAFGVLQMSAAGDKQKQIDDLQARLAAAEKARDEATRKANQAQSDLEDANHHIAQISKERDDLKGRYKDALANEEKNNGIAAAPAPGRRDDAAARQGIRELMGAFAKKMDDPEVKQAMKDTQVRIVAGVYDALFKKLGLSEENAKLAADLIAERNMAAFEKGRKIMDGDNSEASLAGVRKDVDAVKSDYDTKLRSVLGEQGFGEFSNYEQTIGDQRSLDYFSRNFDSKGVPLQAEQRDALSNIMREERLKNPSNDIPDVGGGPGMTMLMSDDEIKARQQQEADYQSRVLNRASQAGLSPDQVNVLQDSFKQSNQFRTMGRTFGRLFIGR